MEYKVWNWQTLQAELDAWRDGGHVATLWWRDDDAGQATEGLKRLLEQSAAHAVPLTLATIPTQADNGTAGLVADFPLATVIQHGYAHINHAPKGAGAWELGAHRPRATILNELAQGHAHLDALFGAQFLPVLAPPWSRIDPDLVPDIQRAGLTGLSGFWPRRTIDGAPDLPQVNAHVAVSDWKPEARFAGEENVIYDLLLHLWQRRHGEADPAEPTGLLTHHWVHDEPTWQFLDRFFKFCAGHSAVRWVGAPAAFADVGRASAA